MTDHKPTEADLNALDITPGEAAEINAIAHPLLAGAAAGLGKTHGYSIPLLRSGLRVAIAMSTRQLIAHLRADKFAALQAQRLGLAGLAGATVVALFAAFPKEMIAALAGLALLGTIGANLAVACGEGEHREAAVITLLVTASGVSFFGVAAAFWGIVAGSLTLLTVNGLRRGR